MLREECRRRRRHIAERVIDDMHGGNRPTPGRLLQLLVETHVVYARNSGEDSQEIEVVTDETRTARPG